VPNKLISLTIEIGLFSYEKAGTHQFEVPRMLFDNPSMLEMYVKKAKDP